MRIGLDGTPVWGPPVGQYTYMANLIAALLKLETPHEFTVYCRREVPEVFQPFADRARFRICRFKNRKLCEQVGIPFLARFDRLDVLHTCWCRPFLYRGRNVFNIMGLEWRTHPDVPIHSRLNHWYYKTTIEATCTRADRLIAISRFMKRTFVDWMHIPGDRIDVVYLGVNLDTYRMVTDAARLDAVRARWGLPARFILFVGALLANKNLDRIVQAFAQLQARTDFQDVGLVIAGAEGWNSSPLHARVKALGLDRKVIFTGFVSEEDKVSLYNLATVYAFPSLVEGFGLPVLEAFACGAPVVTANVTAMPEVAGDAAILVNPLSVEELAEGIARILSDERLGKELAARGRARAREFTWERTARQMLSVYEKACGA